MSSHSRWLRWVRWLRCPAARRIPAVVTLAMAVGGCGGGETGREGSIGPDPLWGEGDAWRVQAEPSVVIGAVDGAVETSFGELGQPVRTPDGRIVVPDLEAGELRWFGPDGEFLTRWGRSGDGPGEYRRPRAVFSLGGDSLLVDDLQASRLTWLGPDGEPTRLDRPPSIEVRRSGGGPAIASENRPVVVGTFQDGSLLLRAPAYSRWPERTGERWVDSVAWHRWAPEGGEPVRLAAGAGLEAFSHDWNGQPIKGAVIFGGQGRAAAGRDRVFLAPGAASFLVHVLAAGGDTVGSLERPWEPAVPTGEDVERYVAWRMGQSSAPTTEEARADWLRVFDESPVADTLPATARVLVDATHHVWVEHYRPVDSDPPTWSVFDPEGRWLGEVVTPDGVEVAQIGEDWLLGTRAGPLDIPQVVLHPVTRPPGE